MADHLKPEEIKQHATLQMPHGGMYWGGYPGTGSHGCAGCGPQHQGWYGGHGWHHQPGWGHHHPWSGYHQTWWGHLQHPWWGHHQPGWGHTGWGQHPMQHQGQQWGGYPSGPGWKREDE